MANMPLVGQSVRSFRQLGILIALLLLAPQIVLASESMFSIGPPVIEHESYTLTPPSHQNLDLFVVLSPEAGKDDVQAVTDWLLAGGFRITSSGNASISASGNVEDVEALLETKIMMMTDGISYGNVVDAKIPERFTKVIRYVSGLTTPPTGLWGGSIKRHTEEASPTPVESPHT